MAVVIHTRKGKYRYAYEHTRESDKVISRYMYPVNEKGDKIKQYQKEVVQQPEQKREKTEQQQAEQILIQQSIEKETHNGYVKGKIYYPLSGEKIKFGNYIFLSFMGSPPNMELPLKLVSAKNYYTTVGYKNNVELVVKDANDVKYTFRDAHYYSPHGYNPIEKKEVVQYCDKKCTK